MLHVAISTLHHSKDSRARLQHRIGTVLSSATHAGYSPWQFASPLAGGLVPIASSPSRLNMGVETGEGDRAAGKRDPCPIPTNPMQRLLRVGYIISRTPVS